MKGMTAKRDTPLRRAYKCVMQMMQSGVPFERAEAFIEGDGCAELEDEERALLWLLAWTAGAPSEVAAYLGRGGVAPVVVRGV